MSIPDSELQSSIDVVKKFMSNEITVLNGIVDKNNPDEFFAKLQELSKYGFFVQTEPVNKKVIGMCLST